MWSLSLSNVDVGADANRNRNTSELRTVRLKSLKNNLLIRIHAQTLILLICSAIKDITEYTNGSMFKSSAAFKNRAIDSIGIRSNNFNSHGKQSRV